MSEAQIRAVAAQATDAASAQAALAGLTLHTAPLEAVLADLSADSWVAGKLAAIDQLSTVALSKAALRKADGDAGDTPVNWSAWTPGDINAGNVVVHGGLEQLLGSQGIAIQGITGSAMTSLGNVIGVSLIAGEPVDRLAGNLGTYGYVTPDRAERIAHTETARAVTAATFDSYAVNGVEQWNLVLSDGACQLCADAQEAGPYEPGDTENSPPVHPYCRCATSPVVKDHQALAAGQDVAIGLGVEEAAADAEGDDGLLRTLWDDVNGYLNGDVLGDYTTDLQGRRLAVAAGRAAPDTFDLSAATDEELAQAVASEPGSSEIGEDATFNLLSELDSRDEDDVAIGAIQAALAWDGTGTPPANPYAGTDVADDWQQAFDDARGNPEQARSDLRDFEANNLEG